MSVYDDIGTVLFTEDQIRVRCLELAKQIEKDYRDSDRLLVVGLLKGSVPFLSQLIKGFTLDIELDFMDVSSYAGTESTGEIRVDKDLDGSIAGRDVLLVEDIIDTGRTIRSVRNMLYARKPKSVKIVALLDKPSRRLFDISADYIGFEVEDVFVVGFGLDYDQHYRHLPFIGVPKKFMSES